MKKRSRGAAFTVEFIIYFPFFMGIFFLLLAIHFIFMSRMVFHAFADKLAEACMYQTPFTNSPTSAQDVVGCMSTPDIQKQIIVLYPGGYYNGNNNDLGLFLCRGVVDITAHLVTPSSATIPNYNGNLAQLAQLSVVCRLSRPGSVFLENSANNIFAAYGMNFNFNAAMSISKIFAFYLTN